MARRLEAPHAGGVEGQVVGADVWEALVQVADTSPFVPSSVERRTTALSGGALAPITRSRTSGACVSLPAVGWTATGGRDAQAPLVCERAVGARRQRMSDVCPPLGWGRQPSTVLKAVDSLLANKGRRQLYDLLHISHDAGGLWPLELIAAAPLLRDKHSGHVEQKDS